MSTRTMRDAFFSRLYDVMQGDKRVMHLTADMGAPAQDRIRQGFPERFLNVGIAEQAMVTIAAGLALSGKRPVIYAIDTFVVSRAWEPWRVTASLGNLPIMAVGVGAGFGYGDSGPTHHATDDLAGMLVLPNMTILSPADSVMAAACARMVISLSGPSYVRLERQILPSLYQDDEDFSPGFGVLRAGKDLTIVSTGFMTHRALEVADALAKKEIDAGVVDMYRLKPLSEKLVQTLFQARRIVTVEEHSKINGMGSFVTVALSDAGANIPILRFGIPDRYYYVYGRDEIHRQCGLDTDNIVQEVLNWVKNM